MKISSLNIYHLNRGIYNLIGIGYLILLLKNGSFKPKIREVILIIIILFRLILLKDYESVSLVSLILIDRIELKKVKLKKILWGVVLATICYSIYFKPLTGRPIATSIGEINISGFSILILYLIADYQKYNVLKKIFLGLGFFTYSRNFLLAVLLNLILKKIRLRKFLLKICQNFLFLSIFTLIFMLIVGALFQNYVEEKGVNKYQSGLRRYTTLVDNSNLYRVQANSNVIKFYDRYPQKLLTGVTLKEFREDIKKNLVEYNVSHAYSPHNFFYKYLLKYGIFSFYLFWYISKIIGKITNNKVEYFIPYYSYSLILGVGFYDFYLLTLKYLLLTKKNNK